MSVDMKAVEEVSERFNNSIEDLARELKRVQSIKCRLKKQKARKDYEEQMTGVLQYEEVLKEARQLLDPKDKPVTNYTQEDVDALDYDETIKAIRSIQSKKSLTRFAGEVEGESDEYKSACNIEAMLVAHRKEIAPVSEGHVRKSDIITIIDTIEESGKLSKDKVVELLKSLL